MCDFGEALVPEPLRATGEHTQEAFATPCWLLCKGKQVELARKGTEKGSHLQKQPEQRNQMWAGVQSGDGLLNGSSTVVLFVCLFLRLIIYLFDRGLLP
jgi:hypothetical protein